jgi:hypothetical protein
MLKVMTFKLTVAARPVLAVDAANIMANNAHRANRRPDDVEDGIRIVRFMSCSLKARKTVAMRVGKSTFDAGSSRKT